MPNLTPEQLRAALDRLAADDSENSFGDAIAQVVAHGDQRFAPLAVMKAALGAEGAGLDEAAAVALLQAAGAVIMNKVSAFPTWSRFFLPALQVLADGQTKSYKEIVSAIAKHLRLSPSLCNSATQKSSEPRLNNKMRFTCLHLKWAGLLDCPANGSFKITDEGARLLLKDDLKEITPGFLREHYPLYAERFDNSKDVEVEGNPCVWIVGSGTSGSMKDVFLSGYYVGVDFGIRVNLAAATAEEIDQAFQRHGDDTRGENQRASEDFCHEVEVGDYVLLKSGRSLIVAYGRIDGEYEFKADAVSYPHQRKVTWLRTDEFAIPRETGMLPLKTLTEAKQSNPAIKAALDHYRTSDIRTVKAVWIALPPSPRADFTSGRLTFEWPGENPPEKPRPPKKMMRPRFHFGQMGIPVGSALRFTEGDVQIEVIGDRKVRYENRERSLTEVTRTLKQLDRNVQPVRYWTFQGKNLLDIYNATYPRRATEDGTSDDWRQYFMYGMQLGDLVIARTEAAQTYRIGEVASTPQNNLDRHTGHHWREIKWREQMVSSAELAELEEDPVEPLDDDNLPESIRAQLFPSKPATTLAKLMTSKPTNLILFGPPGTGKTYVTAQHAVALCQGRPLEELSKESYRDQLMADYRQLFESGNIAFVTFHQTYDYTDFVEGIRPKVTEGRMTYELMPGVLRRLSALATDTQRQGEQFVLIIDEINRGNVSKILGELITLIETDKRLGAKNELRVTLPISGETFGLPRNLHLIGTMNTADRSIALIDTALRRRFDFIPMDPQPAVLESANYSGEVRPGEFLTALNRKLAEVFRDREHAIGHAWFMVDGEKPRSQEQVLKAFKDKVVPTLTEWLWDSPEKLQEILGSEVVDEFGKVDPAKITGKCLKDILGNPAKSPPAS
jgi:hypothetical protein